MSTVRHVLDEKGRSVHHVHPDVSVFDALKIMAENQIGALVWALNPGWDTGGILTPDWQLVESAKQAAYHQLAAEPIDLPSTSPSSSR